MTPNVQIKSLLKLLSEGVYEKEHISSFFYNYLQSITRNVG